MTRYLYTVGFRYKGNEVALDWRGLQRNFTGHTAEDAIRKAKKEVASYGLAYVCEIDEVSKGPEVHG